MTAAQKFAWQEAGSEGFQKGQKAHWYQDKKTAKPQPENHNLICEKALA